MSAPTTQYKLNDDRRTITCLYCRKDQEVARLAISITCRHCNKPLKLDPITINSYEARRQIATCGVVTAEKKANIIAELIMCGRMVIRGRIKGNINSQGPVLIGREAEVKGDVTAPTLAVGAGAVLEGQYDIGPKAVQKADAEPAE